MSNDLAIAEIKKELMSALKSSDFKFRFGLASNIDGATDGATKATKHKLSALLKAIVKSEGKRTPDYKAITNLGSERTMERYIE